MHLSDSTDQNQKLIKVLILEVKNDQIGEEGYLLEVNREAVVLKANKPETLFAKFNNKHKQCKLPATTQTPRDATQLPCSE
mgnify:CR=1 FL=1